MDAGEQPELPAAQPPLPNTPEAFAVYSTTYGAVFEDAGAQFGAFVWIPLPGTIEARRNALAKLPCSSRAGAISAHGAEISPGRVPEPDVIVELGITRMLSGPQVTGRDS